METTITQEVASEVLNVVDKGLCKGLAEPIPGQMCVEAAVCYALGQTHGDADLRIASVATIRDAFE